MAGHVNDHMLDVTNQGHINDGLYDYFGGHPSPLDPDSTLFYDFAVTRDLVDEINGLALTFTRADIGWSYDAAGLLVENAIDAPRFDYDPVTLESLGLLIEQARTNLCLWSRNMAQTAWAKVDMTAAQTQVGIGGVGATATLLTADAANATVLQTVTGAATDRAFSVSIRRVTGSGQVEISGDAFTGSLPITVTNNYQRFSVEANALDPQFGIRLSVSGDEIAVDVAQLEDGTLATSPIITAASTVTRTIENCFTNDMSWYNLVTGTAYASGYMKDGGSVRAERQLFSISDGAVTNELRSLQALNPQFSNLNVTRTISSGQDILQNTSIWDTPSLHKSALTYAAGDFSGATDGVLGNGAPLVADPLLQPNILRIGTRFDGTQKLLNGHIRVFAYANVRKDDAFLQDVTT